MKKELIEQLIMKDNKELKEASTDYNIAVLEYRAKIDTELLKIKKTNFVLAATAFLLTAYLTLTAIHDASRDHSKDYYALKMEAVQEKLDKRMAKLHWIH